MLDISGGSRQLHKLLETRIRRVFAAVIKSKTQSDFHLLTPTSLPKGVALTALKRIPLSEGHWAWRIEGTFGGELKPGRYHSVIRFPTRGCKTTVNNGGAPKTDPVVQFEFATTVVPRN